MPQIAMAWPRCSGGYASSITDCDSGTSAAPNAPCRSRANTMAPMSCDDAQSSDATVNPAQQMMNRRFRPNRSDIQPIGAVMMAEATM